MNIIGIDPSLISTAVTIKTSKETKLFCFYKDKKFGKWEKIMQDYITFKTHTFSDYKKMKYSEEQLAKMEDYQNIVDSIIDTILNNIDDNEDTHICIEGYSYSSSAGPLIDLVTFSTLLRTSLKEYVSSNITILAPGELKKGCAMIAYEQGEDKAYRNYEIQKNGKGLAGGSFKKHDMARAMIDHYGKTGEIINTDMHKFLMEYKDEIFSMKGFPKPADDINDSIWLVKIHETRINI